MSDIESVVYFVQEPPIFYKDGVPVAKDFSSAQRYGTIEYLLTQQEVASQAPGPYYNKVLRGLQKFRPEKDYICHAGGDPLALALAVLTLRNMNFREATFLRWERERSSDGGRSNGFYVPQTLPLF